MKNKTNKPTKKARIWAWLKAGNSITPMLAKEMFNCMSLAQRVCEWRAAGHNIKSKTIVTADGARPSEYWLEA